MLLGNCATTTRMLSDRCDRTLMFGERLRVRVHLLNCDGCRTYASQLDALRYVSRVAAGRTDVDVHPEDD
ncbi:zf-HC2 domain-containing protein [Pandoraea sputorum]|uniref:zf-HC2 domain-containing protein n=1 Tax=Pandoraea sputorum TaxID=93222 RepID=UPI001E3571D0|nr:zf-HC2 domain-containing protein [Pandoraea sputorum]MCE4060055.1 zf-HC2 domain-containing protein [Pandoraea sputorum]